MFFTLVVSNMILFIVFFYLFNIISNNIESSNTNINKRNN